MCFKYVLQIFIKCNKLNRSIGIVLSIIISYDSINCICYKTVHML